MTGGGWYWPAGPGICESAEAAVRLQGEGHIRMNLATIPGEKPLRIRRLLFTLAMEPGLQPRPWLNASPTMAGERP